MSRITNRTLGLGAVCLLLLVQGAGGALAQTGTEATSGSQLLKSVQQGEKRCGDLSSTDFELIGESWMGQMFGSAQAHESMDRMMSSMMGSSGEEQMHEYMGRRASGCGGGSLPAGFAQMMNGAGGMMGMMAMMGGYQGSGPSGMMGGEGSGVMGGGSGSMMGGGDDDDDHVSGWGVVAVILLMAVFLGAFFFIFRRPRPATAGTTPTHILQRRFAAGEITRDDYERRLRVLGGER